jgi:hypothetical protein
MPFPPQPPRVRYPKRTRLRIHSVGACRTPEPQAEKVKAFEAPPRGSCRSLRSRDPRPIPDHVELPNQCSTGAVLRGEGR